MERTYVIKVWDFSTAVTGRLIGYISNGNVVTKKHSEKFNNHFDAMRARNEFNVVHKNHQYKLIIVYNLD